jgi:hypothetical protein
MVRLLAPLPVILDLVRATGAQLATNFSSSPFAVLGLFFLSPRFGLHTLLAPVDSV